MIFEAAHARLILAGRKTQTRRRVRPGETECRYRLGGSYAVQHDRQTPATGRLIVVSVARQALGDITLRDAKAEGHRTRQEFFDFWGGLFPTMTLDDPVWALVICPDRDPVRLLHRDSSRGYTTKRHQALPDEPEAVDDDALAYFTARARGRERDRRDSIPLDHRLGRALDRASSSGVDVTREAAAIARRVDAIERKSWTGLAVPSDPARRIPG